MPLRGMNLAHEEFLVTEKQYIDDLHALVQLSKALPKLGGVDGGATSAIFINVGEILEVNQVFAADCMDDGCSVEQLARAFISSSGNMARVYRAYTSRHLDALEQLERHIKDPDFDRVVRAFLETLKRQSIRNLLIKPIQRVCRYPLLFQEVIRYNESPSALPYLQKALECSNRLCEEVENPVVGSPRADPMVRRLLHDAALTRSTGSVQPLRHGSPAGIRLGGSVPSGTSGIGSAGGHGVGGHGFAAPTQGRQASKDTPLAPSRGLDSPPDGGGEGSRSRSASLSSSPGATSPIMQVLTKGRRRVSSGVSPVLPLLVAQASPPKLVLSKSKTTPNLNLPMSPLSSPPGVLTPPTAQVVADEDTTTGSKRRDGRRRRREALLREMERLSGEMARVVRELGELG
jgi:hypothetical protein